ncbi:jg9646 [Pararge aegeria aegeria]|uniref:Jg9646 protein n=1 Tax=Pararge aegeria aegeria TaxID=348720 RepID=A0A8S4RRA4_9NEOP|nr:jg9646 [Pararge aegeria aegeria]
MGERETAVINGELTLYHTRPEDAGVYQCKVETSYGGLVLLEVTDVENYTVVKPSSSRGPYPAPPKTINRDLVIFTSWTPWSECSTCNVVGRRRRYGICYVALTEYKVPCKNGIFEIRSDTGKVLERVNNTAGIYSLCQRKPLQPPLIARETMFVLPGVKISIICPGTTGRDIPVSWRIGNTLVAPRQLDASTGGKVHLNSRDRIVFSLVEYDDANVYSCWQGDILAGVIKLEVSKSAAETYRNRFIFVALIILLILLYNYTRNLLRRILRSSKARVEI